MDIILHYRTSYWNYDRHASLFSVFYWRKINQVNEKNIVDESIMKSSNAFVSYFPLVIIIT